MWHIAAYRKIEYASARTVRSLVFLVLLRDLVIAEIGTASSSLCTSGVN